MKSISRRFFINTILAAMCVPSIGFANENQPSQKNKSTETFVDKLLKGDLPSNSRSDNAAASDMSDDSQSKIVTPSSVVRADRQLMFFATDIAKDAPCRLYIFEKNAMTFRSNSDSDFCLGDIVDKTDDETEAMFREADAISRNENHDYKNTFYEFDVPPAISTIELETDRSGNNVVAENVLLGSETLHQVVLGGESLYDPGATNPELYFFDATQPQPIYTAFFGGWRGNGFYNNDLNGYYLLKLDNENDMSFSFDEIGTEGTQTV